MWVGNLTTTVWIIIKIMGSWGAPDLVHALIMRTTIWNMISAYCGLNKDGCLWQTPYSYTFTFFISIEIFWCLNEDKSRFRQLCLVEQVIRHWLNTWWRHQKETFSALLTICAGNSPTIDEFTSQRPVTRALMFSLICASINVWVNNREAGDLRRHQAHYDVNIMKQ